MVPMPVKKIGKRWYYDFRIRTVRYRGVIPEAMTKAQAEKAEAKIRLEIYEGKFGAEASNTRFSDFVEKVFLPWSRSNKRTFRDDVLNGRVLCGYFGSKSFIQISPLLIEKFKGERRDSMTRYGRQRRPATVNRELATLSRIFSLAIDNGVLVSNPCRKVRKLREDNERTRYLTWEEEQKLMAALTGLRQHIIPIVRMAIHTGMRRGELLNLRWQYIDFARGIIHVTNTKTNRNRDVPMNSEVREILLGLQCGLCEGYVFKNPKTGEKLNDIKKAFNSAVREAGITDFKFHDLRHTAGTRLADAGADAFTIAEVLGHGSLQMTKRYTHATDERKRRAVESLARWSKVGQKQEEAASVAAPKLLNIK
jgi:integrase